MAPDVHRAASEGYALEAGTYARGRPGYPSALSDWLKGPLGLREGLRAADIGAGTGKFTKLLVATGAEVLAVEPVEEMRLQLAKLDGVRVLPGTAQALPFDDASMDALVCAQAFHWFASTMALDEFARVLRPGGSLGLVWNVRDESVDWVERMTRIISPFEGDVPRYYKGDWRKAFPHPRFGELHECSFEHAHLGPPEEVIVDRSLSVSFIAALPAQEKAKVRAGLEELVARHPALQGRATVAFPYRTVAFHCRRIG